MSRTDLEQDDQNHDQHQKSTNAAFNDDRQRMVLLIFQEDDSDLDKTKRSPNKSGAANEEKNPTCYFKEQNTRTWQQPVY